MMEPRIQYAKSSDGVNIGYWTYGEGPPLIFLPHPVWGTTHASWQLPEYRAWYERLGLRHRLIRYDFRGTGESDRHAADYSLAAHVRDLEAVADALDLKSVAVAGYIYSTPVAIAFAAKHQERVSHLITWCGLASIPKHTETSRQQAMSSLHSMAEQEWDLYVNTMAGTRHGGDANNLRGRMVELMRRSVDPGELTSILTEIRTFDVTALLSDVRCPTLVIHPRDNPVIQQADARELAAGIAGAHLTMLKGDAPLLTDPETSARVIEDFLGTTGPATSPARADIHSILFTDLASSTALTQRLGDAKAQELVRAHNAIVREALASCGGTEIKHTGDGIMASFGSASGALECAIAIQRGVEGRRSKVEGTDGDLAVKIGLNAGEPVAEESDLFGTAVQLARRVCDQAGDGEILVSDVVRQLAAGKDFLFSDRGVADLKGFDEPVRLFEVRWREGE
jgi:class 3 adenylate cyclase